MCWGTTGAAEIGQADHLQSTHRNGEEYDGDRIMDFSDLFTFSSAHSNCGCSSVSSIRRRGSDRG